MLCFCFLELGIGPSVFTKFKLNQENLPLVRIQFLVFSKLLKELRVVTREEHTVLGKLRRASGRSSEKRLLKHVLLGWVA